MQTINERAYLATLADAERRARHSIFDQHVIEDADRGYITIDEGDYPTLPGHIIERIVHTVAGKLSDEY